MRRTIAMLVAVFVGSLGLLSCAHAQAQPAKVTKKAGPSMLDLIDREPGRLRVKQLGGRGPAFAPSVTREYWEKLPERSKTCSNMLLNMQASAAAANALRANRSFRNCAIQPSRTYLLERLQTFAREGKVEVLGEALAALHAFYAYSDFTEKAHAAGRSLEELVDAPARVWVAGSPLPELVSDVSAQASPSLCQGTLPQIDKSTPRGYGARVLSGGDWEIPAHEAAIQLAMADTDALLSTVLKQQKEFSNTCGTNIVVAFFARWL